MAFLFSCLSLLGFLHLAQAFPWHTAVRPEPPWQAAPRAATSPSGALGVFFTVVSAIQPTLLTTVFRFLRDQILRPTVNVIPLLEDFCPEFLPLENFPHNTEGTAKGLLYSGASLVAQMVENPPAMQDIRVWSLGWEDSPEEGMATQSSILAWRIPMGIPHQAEEPGGLRFMGSQRVRHDWAHTQVHSFAVMPKSPH